MSATTPTCAVCGALITEERGGELVPDPRTDELVWVHPQCKGRRLEGNG